ncbi:MAG: hypothetical protein ACREQO_12990, partial [Candidatus Binatia bacterium]
RAVLARPLTGVLPRLDVVQGKIFHAAAVSAALGGATRGTLIELGKGSYGRFKQSPRHSMG